MQPYIFTSVEDWRLGDTLWRKLCVFPDTSEVNVWVKSEEMP